MSGMDRVIEKKHKWLKKALWIGGGVLLVGAILYLMIFGDKSSKLNVDLDKITVEEVKQDIFQDYIAVIGTVEPIKTIYLDAIEGGRVEEKVREEGSMLKKGDVIIRLSNHNLLLEISNHEAEVARAVNELRTARLLMVQQLLQTETSIIDMNRQLKQKERNYRNYSELFKTSSVAKEDLDKAKEDYDAAKSTLELLLENRKQDSIYRSVQVASLESSVNRMEKNLVMIRSRLDALDIKAPANGELASLNPEVGEVVNYGSRIGTVNILDSYKLRVDVDEHYIARVRKQLSGECDFSGRNYEARIIKIYPEVKNGRFSVDMVFTDTIPSQIRIGQTSRIKLELGESQTGILLARGGFYQSTGGQWVYVLDKSGKMAVKRNIRIGRQNPRYYEILEGLEPGEQVIVSGYENFGDADKLILKSN